MSLPSFDLTNRVAVVVGATSGIGKAIALALAEAGAAVVATGRRNDLALAVTREIELRGRASLAITTDVTDTGSVDRLVSAVIERFARIDILVNAAGITVRRPTADVSDAEWNEIMNTNLTGMLRACRAVGPHMIERRYGRIVNIGSLTSVVALQEVAAYGASKAAWLRSPNRWRWNGRPTECASTPFCRGFFARLSTRDCLMGLSAAASC